MKNHWKYIILILINIMLFVVMMLPVIQANTVYTKAVQVGIVIVTFILIRIYFKDRGYLNEKK
ncbi:hypothetical protein ROU88_08800 [Macrococcus capreoli]|uniref:hypothetical protein n=1 Tax=Macrococcus capreoli TaxID=2982690 RepID=UPI0021D59E4D|nr:hypothetical protein [Macrococcus sp. TMW 2.2395]MCU7557809.1 hypothetical protein [Macrococcus sp. TMW 2.2395]